ncbi:MAG: SRPBCC family protein [Alphaproteobacteria bacterium]
MTVSGNHPEPQRANPSVALVVRRTINAAADRVFAAWTEPGELMQWWGPATASCSGAQIDLTVGGRYRIANHFPDGTIIWIHGVFEQIEPPSKLVYSWQLESQSHPAERVTVRFVPHAPAITEVIVTHERIADPGICDRHELGWNGCLDGLAVYLKAAMPIE